MRASDNAEVWRWDSDPFGVTGPTNPTAGVAFTYNFRFPGQYLDRESAIHHNGMRDYRPQTGRYLQADPLGLGGGLSRYAYVAGNPLSYSDPSGLEYLFFNEGAGSGIYNTYQPGSTPWGSNMSTSDKFQTLLLVGGVAGMGAGALYGLSIGAAEFQAMSAWMIGGSAMDGAMLGATLGAATGSIAGSYVSLKDYFSRDKTPGPVLQCPRP